MLRILARGLLDRLRTDQVVFYPCMEETGPDLKVGFRIFRFDGELGKNVQLNCVLSLQAGGGVYSVEIQGFSISSPTADARYPAMVKAMSEVLNQLADKIIVAMGQIKPGVICTVGGKAPLTTV